MINEVTELFVNYNNSRVGLLKCINGKIAFQYDDSWIKKGFSISPISLPLTKDIFINKKDTFDGLYGVFMDSLPDGWGELLVTRMLAKKGISYQKLNPLTKLALVSNNGMGGLQYQPTLGDSEYSDVDLNQLAKEVKEILNDKITNQNIDSLYKVGGSSGGTRPKAHLCVDDEEWIVKFPCLNDPKNIGKLEYEANTLAKKANINVNVFKLFPSNYTDGYFASKRFDRDKQIRIHMISLSSILETSHRIPNLDYMHLFNVISVIGCPLEDIYEAYRRMCFNVLFKNKDDHGKNFSFIYDEKNHTYRLSPMYDITQTLDKPEHEMTILGNGKPTDIDLIKIAQQLKLKKSKYLKIIDEVKKIIASN